MEFNYFDLAAASIILLLGLKGIINGFFKEVFGLVGIIGGIFIASRMGDEVGLYLSNLIFKFDNNAAISFTGFLTALAAFWLAMIILGTIFKKLSSMSGLGIVDKILGFIVGSSKFFLIAAVIAYAAYNIKTVKTTLDTALEKSILFPIMVETGAFIMKIDPIVASDTINKSIDTATETIKSSVSQEVNNTIAQKVEEIKEEMKEAH